MHSEKWNSWSFWLSLTAGGPLPPPKNLHVLIAASNTGPLNGTPPMVVVPLPGELTTEMPSPPPLLVGSGKPGTPCARMHSDSLSCSFEGALADLGREPPHAASA